MTNTKTCSDLITDITKLWWTWKRLYPKTQNPMLSWDERAKIVSECESIYKKINNHIKQIDDLFGND